MSSTSMKERQECNSMQAMWCLVFLPIQEDSLLIQYNMSLPNFFLNNKIAQDSEVAIQRQWNGSRELQLLGASDNIKAFNFLLRYKNWLARKGNHILPNFCNPTQSCSPWCYRRGSLRFLRFSNKVCWDHNLPWSLSLVVVLHAEMQWPLQTWLGQRLVENGEHNLHVFLQPFLFKNCCVCVDEDVVEFRFVGSDQKSKLCWAALVTCSATTCWQTTCLHISCL